MSERAPTTEATDFLGKIKDQQKADNITFKDAYPEAVTKTEEKGLKGDREHRLIKNDIFLKDFDGLNKPLTEKQQEDFKNRVKRATEILNSLDHPKVRDYRDALEVMRSEIRDNLEVVMRDVEIDEKLIENKTISPEGAKRMKELLEECEAKMIEEGFVAGATAFR